MKKHPRLKRFTIDVEHNLSILEGDEDDGNSPVVEAYSEEHALQNALVELKRERSDLQLAREIIVQRGQELRKLQEEHKPLPATHLSQQKIAAIKRLRERTGLGLCDAKNLVDFVLYYATYGYDASGTLVVNPTIALNNWAVAEGYLKLDR